MAVVHRRRRAESKRGESGVATITVLVATVALFALASLAIDVGLLWTARSQLQNSVDAAALAGASNLLAGGGASTTPAAARAAAVDQAGDHRAASTSSVVVPEADVAIGDWDLETRTFNGSVDESDPNAVNAVEVTAFMNGVTNGPVPAFMARVLGRQSFNASATATAYLGYAGGVTAGALALPIAIDCCKLAGPDCDADYCAHITSNPPNPCPLDSPQSDGVTTVSCLEFFNTPDQNACWTVFDGNSPSVNTTDLREIIQSGQEFPVNTSDPIYLDNGTKTPVVSDIYDRFMGEGAFASGEPPGGTDRYAPYNGPDSWVVALPVMECQTEAHCASGDPMHVVGIVCFEVREVVVTPDKIIRGRFLCPGDPLIAECDLDFSGGGSDFGLRADFPVLVR